MDTKPDFSLVVHSPFAKRKFMSKFRFAKLSNVKKCVLSQEIEWLFNCCKW